MESKIAQTWEVLPLTTMPTANNLNYTKYGAFWRVAWKNKQIVTWRNPMRIFIAEVLALNKIYIYTKCIRSKEGGAP